MRAISNICTLAIITLFLGCQALTAGDTACTGTLTGEYDNVTIPEGASCLLRDANVAGNIEVKASAALTIAGATRVNGNVQSDGGRYVRVLGAAVNIDGDVQIKKSTEWSGYETGTQILGNFQYEESNGFLLASGGVIHGNFVMFKNTGGGAVVGNRVQQNLQCKENVPTPAGGDNLASGNKKTSVLICEPRPYR